MSRNVAESIETSSITRLRYWRATTGIRWRMYPHVNWSSRTSGRRPGVECNVVVPRLTAAIPVVAHKRAHFGSCSICARTENVFPVPAAPVRYSTGVSTFSSFVPSSSSSTSGDEFRTESMSLSIMVALPFQLRQYFDRVREIVAPLREINDNSGDRAVRGRLRARGLPRGPLTHHYSARFLQVIQHPRPGRAVLLRDRVHVESCGHILFDECDVEFRHLRLLLRCVHQRRRYWVQARLLILTRRVHLRERVDPRGRDLHAVHAIPAHRNLVDEVERDLLDPNLLMRPTKFHQRYPDDIGEAPTTNPPTVRKGPVTNTSNAKRLPECAPLLIHSSSTYWSKSVQVPRS